MIDGPRQERIDSARAEVKQAEADVAKAKWRLNNCRILAPISGTILKKNAEEGNIVNPIAFNGSFSVCDMADLSDLEVSLDIQERDVSRVFKGQKCRIRADAFPDRVYYGVVSRLMPIADRAKGAVPVRVKLTVPADEEGVYLKPEMGAVVAFLNGPPDTLAAEKNGPKKANEGEPKEEKSTDASNGNGPSSDEPTAASTKPEKTSPPLSADPNFKPDSAPPEPEPKPNGKPADTLDADEKPTTERAAKEKSDTEAPADEPPSAEPPSEPTSNETKSSQTEGSQR